MTDTAIVEEPPAEPVEDEKTRYLSKNKNKFINLYVNYILIYVVF